MLLPVSLVASISSKHKQLPLLVLSGEDGKEYVGCCDSLLVASYAVVGAGMIAWCHLHVLLLDSRLQVPLHGTEQTSELTPLPKYIYIYYYIYMLVHRVTVIKIYKQFTHK